MKNIFKICAMVFLAAIGTFGQGTLQQSDVRSTPGPVVPGATITVCAAGATGIPCFPTTPIFTDPLLSVPSVNPITADGNGNYSFYAAAGAYVISVTGQGLPGRTYAINVPCVPGSLGCASGSTLLSLNNLWTGTNNFTGGLSVNGLPVAGFQGPFTIGDCATYLTTIPLVIGDTPCAGGGGGSGTVVASPQYQLSFFPNPGSVATVKGSSISTDSTFNNLYVPGNLAVKGPNPYFDITEYGARAVTINTTGTGSGTALTVGTGSFINGDGITIVGGGAAPAIAAPAGLAVATGAAGGQTVPDAVMFAGMTGSSTYNYILFACDFFGGCTLPTSAATTTTGPTALGKTQFTVSTWSLTGNTLTIITSSSSGLPVGTRVHISGTSNNTLAGGTYPVGTSSGTTLIFNNVPQYAATTTTGTGGTVTAFVGNPLTWTASTGGTPGTQNMPWKYYVCAERPGDGAYHIIGSSLPSTFYAEASGGNFSTTFVDFGTTLSANPIIPWYISNSNCTAGAAQNELFTTTVSAGGGTTGLTLTGSMPSAVTGAAVRRDDAPAFTASAAQAITNHGTVYIPLTTGLTFNSPIGAFYGINILQAGPITLNDTVMLNGGVSWQGMGSSPPPGFGFNGAPVVTCNAWPCIYVAGVNSQGTGGTTFDTLTLTSTQNGLNMLVDANWGMIWNKVNFVSGSNNNDNMGMGLVIRPGASNYTITNSQFAGGPAQVIDQTWTPLFYADKSHTGCCSGGGGVGTILLENTQWNRRGMYYVTNGGGGVVIKASGRWYRQGGIIPMLEVQNISGSILGTVEMGDIFHDTESQAAFAEICGPGCDAADGIFSGLAFHLGNANGTNQDNGTNPGNVTGGGNAAIQQVVGQAGPGGVAAFPSPGWIYYDGALVPTVNINTSGPSGISAPSFIPNVATPKLSLQSGAFTANLTSTPTANRNITVPDASGTICLTTTGACLPVGYVDTGAANAYAIATTPPTTGYVNGAQFYFQGVNANTTASTLNVNGLGAKTIKKNGGTGGSVGSDLASGDIAAGQWVYVVYDGTNFQMQSTLGNAGGGGGSGTVGNCVNAPAVAYYSGAGTTTTCLNLPAFMQFIYAADSGAANAYVVAPTTAATLVTGAQIAFTTANANTGASTINVSSLGVLNLTKLGATALVTGDILANTYYLAEYDGTEWQLLNPSGPCINCAVTNASNTFGAGASVNLSAMNSANAFRIPIGASGATSTNAAMILDSTFQNVHLGANSVDNLVPLLPVSVSITNGDCTQFSNVSSNITLNDAGNGGCTLLNANNVFGASARINLSAATNANAFVLPNQSGAAPTVAGATGFDTAALQPVISDGSIVCPYSKEQVNAQTGSGYTVLTSDCGKLISVSNAANQTLTLPASAPSKGWFIDVQNTGGGTWTITPNGNNLDNLAGSTTIATNQGMRIVSNGSGYFSQRGVGGGGGGGGTVQPASQYSVGYYPNAGSSPTVGGIAAPSAPNGVPQFIEETPSGSAATAPLFAPAGVVPRIVAGASDTILATDRAGEVIYTDAAATAVTLPAAGSSGFASNFVTLLDFTANNILTITPTTSTINGAAALTMGQNDFCFIYSDNSNYYANCTHGQSSAPVVLDTGSANAYAIAYPQVQSLETGSTVLFTVAHANTGASTIAVNGLTTKNLTKNGANSLIANDLITTTIYQAIYDGTQWELINPSSGYQATFSAHKFLGNGTASTAVATPTTIGSSDTSPNWYATDSGAANAYVIAPSPALTALTAGSAVFFTTANANSGASTINVSGLGVKALDKLNVTALVSGDILATAVYEAVYDGTEWILLNASSSGGGSGTVNNCGTAKSAAFYSATGTTVSCTSESALTQYLYAADSGTANAYVVTLAPALGSLVTGEQVFFTTSNANTGASTINVNALGVKNITKFGTTALVSGDIAAGTVYQIVWDGTEWQLINPSGMSHGYISAGGAAAGDTALNPDALFSYNLVTLTSPITITRIGVKVQTAPLTCSPYAQFGIYDNGVQSGATVALTSGVKTYDSGAISINVAAGHTLNLGVTTAESGCGTKAGYPVETIEYQFKSGATTGAIPPVISSSTSPSYGLVSSLSPTFDLVANGGCDPTGVTAADTCFANAIAYFAAQVGGTITGCGTFNLAAPPVVVNTPVAIVNNCGSAGNVDYGTAARGGFVLTSTANVNVTNPPTAPTLTTSISGGSLAATTKFWIQATCVNGFGETLPSPAANITTGSGSSNSITITGLAYSSGCFFYNLYIGTGSSQPANGAMWLLPNANFASHGGNFAGPPFLMGFQASSPVIQLTETSGTNPPASNTAAHGGVLMQLGTPSSIENVSYKLQDISFEDSTNTLSAGLVNYSSTHSQLNHLNFDGFSVAGGTLAGMGTYEGSGIGLVELGRFINYTSIYEPTFSNNTLGILAAGADTTVYGGDVTMPVGGLGMDYPAGNIRVYGTHFDPSGGSGQLGAIVIRGNNNGTHNGGMFSIKAEFVTQYSGPVFNFQYATGMLVDCWCSGNGATTAANPAATFDVNSGGNTLRIAQSTINKIALFSDGTTIGKDLSHNNVIIGSVDGIFAQSYNSNGAAQTSGNIALGAGWQSTGTATVTAVSGSNTEQFTITTGTTTTSGATDTVTVTLPQPSISSVLPVCTLDQHGGNAATPLTFQQTTQSATAPVFTAIGTPSAAGATYIVVMRCGS